MNQLKKTLAGMLLASALGVHCTSVLADIMAQGKNVALTWTEFDGDKTYLLIMQSSDGSQTWLPAKSIAESTGKTDFPFLLANSQGLFVSWNSKKEGYRLIGVNPAVILPTAR